MKSYKEHQVSELLAKGKLISEDNGITYNAEAMSLADTRTASKLAYAAFKAYRAFEVKQKKEHDTYVKGLGKSLEKSLRGIEVKDIVVTGIHTPTGLLSSQDHGGIMVKVKHTNSRDKREYHISLLDFAKRK